MHLGSSVSLKLGFRGRIFHLSFPNSICCVYSMSSASSFASVNFNFAQLLCQMVLSRIYLHQAINCLNAAHSLHGKLLTGRPRSKKFFTVGFEFRTDAGPGAYYL